MAELRLQLADRERRLAELTEQSLQILDRLAEARGAPGECTALQARLAEAQAMLADARQRLRVATRAVLGGPLDGVAAAIGAEVAIWGTAGHSAESLARSVGEPGLPVTLLLGPETEADAFADLARPGLSVQETECRTPAHAWNEALAMTDAPVVVLLAAGTVMERAQLDRLVAAAAADGIAVASPLLAHPGGRALGRSERSLLDLVAQPTSATAGVLAVPFASPEAFAIRRSAFARLGPFDQDLLGDLALAEWALRAGAQALRCVGVADALATAVQLRDAGAETPVGESDRMVVLARHRPQQLAAAAMAANSFWQQDPMAVAGTLRAVFRRLPNAAEFGVAIDLLVVQAQTVAGWKRLAPALRDRLLGIAAEMRVPTGDVLTDPGMVTLAERLQSAAGVLRARSQELEHRGQEVHDLRHELELHAHTEQELRQDIIARSNTIDALRHELLERERAIASLREELGHRQGERDRLIDHLGSIQQDLDRLQDEVRRLAATNAALTGDRDRLRAELDQAGVRELAAVQQASARAVVQAREQQLREAELLQQIADLQAENADLRANNVDLAGARTQAEQARARSAELERKLDAEIERSRGLQGRLGEAIGRASELEPQLDSARVTVRQVEGQLAAESGRLQVVLDEIDELRGGHEHLRREHGSLQEQRVELEARAHELVLALRDRERWIATLLAEVAQRRLRRRELTAEEREFLKRHGGERRA